MAWMYILECADGSYYVGSTRNLEQRIFQLSLCNPVMKKFGWKENQYLQITQELGDKGLVRGEKANDNPFFRISITSPGREIVRNNFRIPNSSQNSLQIFGNNNIVNFSSTLNSVDQLVQANSIVESPSKQELERLLRELEVALSCFPEIIEKRSLTAKTVL